MGGALSNTMWVNFKAPNSSARKEHMQLWYVPKCGVI